MHKSLPDSSERMLESMDYTDKPCNDGEGGCLVLNRNHYICCSLIRFLLLLCNRSK